MQTSLTVLEGLKRSLTVELPIEKFTQKTSQVLKDMSATIRLDGFRKGKVPMTILRKRFGASAHSDAAEKLVSETLYTAMKDAKIEPVDKPSLTNIDSKSETVFSYSVEFEVFPEVVIEDFAKLEIEQIQVEITQADEDKTLAGLREQLTEYQPVERNSQADDRLKIDFKGMIDGVVFEGGEAQDFMLVLGKSPMIEGFETGLTDVAKNSLTKLELAFPQPYPQAPNLAGKDVVFEVTVREIAEPIALELDDTFAQKLGEDTMQDLLSGIKSQMQTEMDKRLNAKNQNNVFAALMDAHEFDLPQSSVNQAAQHLFTQQQRTAPTQNLSAADFQNEAKRQVKLRFLLDKMVTEHKISASAEQVQQKLAEIAKNDSANAQQILDYYQQDASRLKDIEPLVIEKMLADLVLEKAQITIKETNFQDLSTTL